MFPKYLVLFFLTNYYQFYCRVRSSSIARVLVFPPVNNYHRFLIHKVELLDNDHVLYLNNEQGETVKTIQWN